MRSKLDAESLASIEGNVANPRRNYSRKRDETLSVISVAKSLLGDPRVSGQGNLAAQVAV
jgi:hypothetical protein